MQLNIKKITVLLRDGHTDKITIDLDLPTTYPAYATSITYPAYATSATSGNPFATIDAAQGYGVQWCKDNLHIEPEVIDARGPRRSK